MMIIQNQYTAGIETIFCFFLTLKKLTTTNPKIWFMTNPITEVYSTWESIGKWIYPVIAATNISIINKIEYILITANIRSFPVAL